MLFIRIALILFLAALVAAYCNYVRLSADLMHWVGPAIVVAVILFLLSLVAGDRRL